MSRIFCSTILALYFTSGVCLADTTPASDVSEAQIFAINDPAITMPTDTTPAWLNKMASPPVFLRKNEAQNPNDKPPEDQNAQSANAAVSTPATDSEYIPPLIPNYIEAGFNYYNVTHNYGNSFGQFVNAQYQTDPWNRWSAGLQHAQAFHDQGEAASLANNHTFNEDWYSDVGVSVGSPASFLTRYRGDASLSRRWLENRNFITSLGFTYDKANKTYSDRTIHLNFAYYFLSPWVIQTGFNLNDSTPGNVIAPSAFIALTYGYQGKYFLTARYGFAHEAYQLLNSGNIQNSFTSHTMGANWRQWLGSDWGFNLGTEFYINPYYTRTGGIVSVFKEF